MRRFLLLCAAVSVLALVARAGDLVLRGPWSGAVTNDSAVVVAKLGTPANGAWLEVSDRVDFGEVSRVESLPALPDQSPEIARFSVTGLSSNTPYYYRVRLAEVPRDPDDDRSHGTFTTFPPPFTPSSFRFAFSSCARSGSTHQVFRRIAAQNPSFYLMAGDLHYEDISWNHRPSFRTAYDTVLGSERQRALYRAVPIVYTWDDHDFGPNGSDRHSPSREASHAVYREYVPHYPLEASASDGPIAQAFTYARVRFLVLDTRSARDAAKQPDDARKSMLGAWQKEWLKRELLAAKGRFPLVFIVSSVAWISNETTQRDNWGRYTTERAELSDWMVENGITGVCFLGGDAHMLAADDGRNNNYARNGGPNFPALQASPLDRTGSLKGGPWSVTPVLPEDGEGQFGIVDIEDRGDSLRVLFRGLNHEGTEKLRFTFSVAAQ